MSVLYVFDCPHGKRLNFLHQCEMCAKEHLASRAETIRQQQSTIDRLTEQLKEQIESGYGLCKRISNPMAVCNCKYCVSDRSRALIAEIEAVK